MPSRDVSRVGVETVLPLWLPFLLAAIPTAFLLLRDRHRQLNHCRSCGYNLTGNVSGVCPECGTPIPKDDKERERTNDPPTKG